MRTGTCCLGLALVSVTLGLPFALACSDGASPASSTNDASAPPPPTEDDGGVSADAEAGTDGGDAAPVPREVEPNDGKTANEIGTITVPGSIAGTLDPADDVDVFSFAPSPGELWEWTVLPASASLAPHLGVFDTAGGNNPTVIATAAAGQMAKVQHFVVNPGSFAAAVRDARNVPSATGKGGPTYGYTLSARTITRTPAAVTFPSTRTGVLAGPGAIDLYAFTGTSAKGFDVVVRAKRKAAPSTLDSRVTLFDATTKTWLITNDDAPGTTDSEVGSDDPAPNASTYLVIVENEGTDGGDLSYEIEFALRP